MLGESNQVMKTMFVCLARSLDLPALFFVMGADR
jgi:hypothetical protein